MLNKLDQFFDLNCTSLTILVVMVFVFSYIALPNLRNLIHKYNFKNESGTRSSHLGNVPTFGGVVFFISYLFVLICIPELRNDSDVLLIIPSFTIIFLTGFLDDLFELTPKVKMLGQLLAVGVLMFSNHFIVSSLNGVFDIYEIPFYLSIPLTALFLVFLTNAFNLIDGIDGLSAITAIVISGFYGWLFYTSEQQLYFVISLVTIASNLAFLRFNFSKHRKIFMGDTGSLLLGMVFGLQTVVLFNTEIHLLNFSFSRSKIFLILTAILFIPILDVFRVILIRFFNKKPLFSPDRNHLHHILIDRGYTHKVVSIMIGLYNICIAAIMFVVVQYVSFIEALFIFIFLFLSSMVALFVLNKNRSAILRKLKIIKTINSFKF